MGNDYIPINYGQNFKKIIQNPSNWFYVIKNQIAQGSPKEALITYTEIQRKGGAKNFVGVNVIPLIIKACALLCFIDYGKSMHAESIKAGVYSDVMVGTSLVDMYSKCGVVGDSRRVFDFMPMRNVVTWNALIGGYMRWGDTKMGYFLFELMGGRSVVTWNVMIGGFARNGNMGMARRLFDRVPEGLRNVVTWTVMVDGYVSNGEMEKAREVFEEMVVKNCYVWSSMISGYFKRGDVREATAVFGKVLERNLVIWNSMISGYSGNGFCEEALEAFGDMRGEGFQPDEITIVSVLSACAQLCLLDVGREIHEMINHNGLEFNQFVLNALVDMYAKCGDLASAEVIFKGIHQKNNAVWNSMISGFATHGNGKEALEFFKKMEDYNEKPDEITFLSVLSACVHGGFVNEGLEIFTRMEKYGLSAGIKHYGCMIDLLGRAGRLSDAFNLIKEMPMKPNISVLGAFLGACRIHMDMEMAERVLEEIGTLCTNDSLHVLLSNIYAASDSWEKAEAAREAMIRDGFQKTPGCSTVMLQ